MMPIMIGLVRKNINNSKNIIICRPSILGNPYKIENENDRVIVCKLYEEYFNKQIKNNTKFYNEVNRIYQLSTKHSINLQCYCYPKLCHGDTIKKYIDEMIKHEEYLKFEW